MNTRDLVKLAHRADLEGDIELADYLDNQLIRKAASNKLINFLSKVRNYSRRPNYNIDFNNLTPDSSNLDMMTAHPTQRGNPVAKFFQAGLKDKTRTPERLNQIETQIVLSLDKVVSSDPKIHSAISKFKSGKHGAISADERNALLNHLINKDKLATRANDIDPDDIVKVLSGQKPSKTTKQVTTLSNFGKAAGGAAVGAGVVGTGVVGTGAYNASKQNAEFQPGGVFQDPNASGGPFQSMPEMNGGMPSMSEMPQMGGGGGYQGPSYSMPSANQSFQSLEGYRPANQFEDLPRFNDQAEPLYPRITPQQAMQNAMTEDQARRYRELMDQGGRPAAAPIVGGGNQEIYGPTQEMAVEPGGVQYVTAPTEEVQMPMPGEAAPSPAVQGVGQAIDLSNPTGFNPANPFNIQ